MSLCMGCMTEKGENEVCPNCGLNEADLTAASTSFIQPGYELKQGRYTVGIALGQGGFGVTYIGYDNVLNTKVAIKEYYPSGSAQREPESRTIIPFTGSDDSFGHGKQKFLEEAQTLAKFSDYPGIVSVRDCFDENGTAYMIMQYLDGIDLKTYINQQGGKLSVDESINILMPVLSALKEVHKAGVIHRDISPDNIFMTSGGQVKLIDFGAARQALGGQKSISVTLKSGYAPEEQYRTRGNQGPWTDVYALSATLYRMITGETPPDSLERFVNDELVIPNELPDNIKYALKKGMAVKAPDRFESVDELQKALTSTGNLNYNVNNLNNFGQGENNRFKQDSQNGNMAQGYTDGSADKYASDYEAYKAEKTRTALIIIASLLGAIVVVLILSVILISVVASNDSDSGDTDTVSSSTVVAETNTETKKQEPYTCGSFPNVTSSGSTTATASNRKYECQYAVDGRCDTAWNVPNGPGQWIRLYSDTTQKVKGIKIVNGYTKYSTGYSMWLYYPNARAKDITVSFSDGTSINKTLEDKFDNGNYIYQNVDFGGVKETSFIKVTINSIYSGNKWTDCCITEIQPY